MCEDVARTMYLARTLGRPLPIAPADVDSLHDRYQNVYGQSGAPAAGPPAQRGTPSI
jgi:L-ribulose-5-phosphate 4-epimerase